MFRFLRTLVGKQEANASSGMRSDRSGTTLPAGPAPSGPRVVPTGPWSSAPSQQTPLRNFTHPRSSAVFALGKNGESLPIAPEHARRVTKVEDEYALVSLIVCQCGKLGTVKVKGQGLTVFNRAMMDEIRASCRTCGAEYTLYFDISDVKTPFGTIGMSSREDEAVLKRFDMKDRENSVEDEF